MTDEMEELAAAPNRNDARTLILAAYLTGAPNMHTSGSFSFSARHPEGALVSYVAYLLLRSPGLCVPNVTVHIVHDLKATSEELTALTGSMETRDDLLKVRWHRVVPSSQMLGNDRRWGHFDDILSNAEWDCAYAIDLSDVMVLRIPPCRSLPNKLLAASDGNVKRWLREITTQTRWNLSVSSKYHNMLMNEQPVISCSVVGGPRAVFQPALRSVVGKMWARARRIELRETTNKLSSSQTESSSPVRMLHRVGTDMVLWNDEFLKWPAMTGYPFGPVSLPPWGTPYVGINRACSTHDCRHKFVNITRHLFWFGHKIQDSWVADYRNFYKDCS